MVFETFQKEGLFRALEGTLGNDTCQVAWTSCFKCLHYLTVLKRFSTGGPHSRRLMPSIPPLYNCA